MAWSLHRKIEKKGSTGIANHVAFLRGTYTESLACGATPRVTRAEWSIDYYFPGPDLRYKGEFFSIKGSEVSGYITAIEAAWDHFTTLQGKAPLPGSFTTAFRRHIVVVINPPFGHSGIYIRNSKTLMSSQADVQKTITAFRQAQAKANEVRRILFGSRGSFIN